jgi:hypothetical protein
MRHFLFTGFRLPRRGRATWSLIIVSLLVLLSRDSAARAEEFEQHHAHEHGKVTLNVAVEGNALVVELDASAANVVGFEHAPRTTAERSAAANAAALLRSGKDVLALPPEAQCRVEQADLTEPTWGKDGHEHHADYEARLTYRCAQPAKLAWFEPSLLGKLPNVTEAQINLITSTGQRSETVKSSRARIALRGS